MNMYMNLSLYFFSSPFKFNMFHSHSVWMERDGFM